jgi:hypothetical protein
MCPSGLTLCHPAGSTLLKYATQECPTLTGKPWTRKMMQEVVDRGAHKSALADRELNCFGSVVPTKVGEFCMVV